MHATYSRRANTALMLGILVIVAAALVALALAHPAKPATTTQLPAAQQPVAITQPIDPFVVELVGPGTEVTPEQVAALLQAADLVCEGVTAGVPEGFMIRDSATTLHLTLEEAHELVELAMHTRCAPIE